MVIIQGILLNTKMSEFHSGYRSFKVEYLKKILFEMNSDDYCFDTEIMIQFILSKFKIKEIAIPTFYGDEISYVNGFKYAIQIIIQTIKGKLHNLNLENSNLEDVNLTSSSISQTNLKNINFQNGILKNSILKNVNLKGANLKGANLNLSYNLTCDQIESAIIDKNTRLPDYILLDRSSTFSGHLNKS